MQEQLFELAYVSSATRYFDEPDLAALLNTARANNSRNGLTGMLLYADGAFIQVLEGAEAKVRGLYEHIGKDPRHARLMIIHEGPLGQRNFPDWSMGFKAVEAGDAARIEGFANLFSADSPLLDRLRENPADSHRLLLSFSECSAIVPTLDSPSQG